MGGVAKAVGSVLGGGPTSSYQAQAPAMQEGLMNKINQSYGAMDPITANQNALAQALLAQSQGQGPNPAMLQMQQAQDRTNKQGAGMLASARGMNPALAARLAAQNTAAGQQQNVQNMGIMGAQQQLAAQQQLQGLYGQQAQQNLNQQGILQGAYSGNQNAQMQAQQINAQIAAGNQASQNALTGQLLGAAGTVGGMMLAGPWGAAAGNVAGQQMAGGMNAQQMRSAPTMAASKGGKVPGEAEVDGDSYANDTVHTMLSPGEIVVPRTKAKDPELAKEFIDHLFQRKGKKKGA